MMFTGKCVGGPLDGQSLSHWARTKKFYRPMVGMSLNMEKSPVEPIEIGEYRLNDFNQWHWWETEAGKVFNVIGKRP